MHYGESSLAWPVTPAAALPRPSSLRCDGRRGSWLTTLHVLACWADRHRHAECSRPPPRGCQEVEGPRELSCGTWSHTGSSSGIHTDAWASGCGASHPCCWASRTATSSIRVVAAVSSSSRQASDHG